LQRSELRKAIKKFSHEANFYRLGLVRKLIQHRDRREKESINNIPKVLCPNCGGTKISVEHTDSEYYNDTWLHCEECEEDFDDEFGYEDAIQTVELLCWGYLVDIELHFENPDIKSAEWQNRCKELILEELKK
jgi:hypothetical protein